MSATVRQGRPARRTRSGRPARAGRSRAGAGSRRPKPNSRAQRRTPARSRSWRRISRQPLSRRADAAAAAAAQARRRARNLDVARNQTAMTQAARAARRRDRRAQRRSGADRVAGQGVVHARRRCGREVAIALPENRASATSTSGSRCWSSCGAARPAFARSHPRNVARRRSAGAHLRLACRTDRRCREGVDLGQSARLRVEQRRAATPCACRCRLCSAREGSHRGVGGRPRDAGAAHAPCAWALRRDRVPVLSGVRATALGGRRRRPPAAGRAGRRTGRSRATARSPRCATPRGPARHDHALQPVGMGAAQSHAGRLRDDRARAVGVLYPQLGQSEDPPFTFKAMVVRTLWPGATADESRSRSPTASRRS